MKFNLGIKKFFVNLLLLSISLFLNGQNKQEVYLNMNVSHHERIMDLLPRLTIEEKISLLWTSSPAIPHLGIDKYYHGNEALHGVVRPGNFTVFPQAIGLAAMWNPQLLNDVSTVISDEARAKWNEMEQGKMQLSKFSDLLTFWSPNVNMARDPRWGRTPETYGEDPFLSGKLGVAFVKGLQGDHPRYLKVVSAPKHFAANNEEHNRFEANPIISERDLREYYFPAFEKCIVEGKAASIMTAFNAINGVPCTLNDWLLKKVLREDWGFNGYVVSDCGGPTRLIQDHKYIKTKETAATLSLKAGLDLECGDDVYNDPLLNAYKKYMVTEAEIDTAAYRILRARMHLGLFDNPSENPYNKLSPSIVGSSKHKELALETARQSIVLLKNRNNFLPLNAKKIKSIAVVGINAGNSEFGDYSGSPVNPPVSVLEGIKNRVGNDIEIIYAPWTSPALGYSLIASSFFPNGLKAEYYSNRDLKDTPKVRTDEMINFEPGNQAPDPFVPNSPLSIRWSGELVPSVSGEYTFAFTTYDGCRLFIDGEKLIDSWSNLQPRILQENEVSMVLEKDKVYELTAEYFNDGGESSAKLFWNAPDSEEQDILDLYGEASEAISKCDLTVAVLGVNKSIEREGQDRYTIELPLDQQIFIKEAYKRNPNTVVVLVAGSSLAINWIDENIPAIVNAWYPGEQGGNAVAEVLFGDFNPAGRLPLTYYKTLDEIPPFGDYDIRKGRTYQFFEGKPLYAFGHGLSYTRFSYKKLKIENLDKEVKVNFVLSNKGKYDGDEVVQLYVSFPEKEVSLPLKQLKGFDRVHLKKGKSKSITILLPKEELRLWSEDSEMFYTPKGEYEIMIGSSSDRIHLKGALNLD